MATGGQTREAADAASWSRGQRGMTRWRRPAPGAVSWRGSGRSPACPLISILLAMVVGAFVIWFSELLLPDHDFDWALPLVAYRSLIEGSIGSFERHRHRRWSRPPLSSSPACRSRSASRPGLFNIGARASSSWAPSAPSWSASMVADQPPIIAIPVAIARGTRCGALLGLHPGHPQGGLGRPRGRDDDHAQLHRDQRPRLGRQRAAEGAGLALADHPRTSATPPCRSSSATPATSGSSSRSRWSSLVRWLLFRTTLGFEIRTVGANPDAARYAGMRPNADRPDDVVVRACWPAWPAPIVVLGVTHHDDEQLRDGRSASTRSPSPCSPGRARSASSSRACCSARCEPAPA